ncbi:unnamed protein product, partial [Ectocarpus sp. 12 AP-2014]
AQQPGVFEIAGESRENFPVKISWRPVDVVHGVNNRARLLEIQVRALRISKIFRTVHTCFESLVPSRPVAYTTPLLPKQGKYDEADPLYLRAIEIGERTLGPDH